MSLINLFSLIMIITMLATNIFADNLKYIILKTTNRCLSSLYQKLTQEEQVQLITNLFDAIENNDFQAVKKTLETGAPPNTIKVTRHSTQIRPTIRSALHAAVFTGNPLIVELLLTSGTIPILTIKDGLSAFSYLAYQHHISSADRRAITELFIATGIEQKHIDEAFHHAAIAMNFSVGEVIYEQGGPSRRIDNILNTRYTFMDKLTYLVGLFTASLSMQEDMETKYKYKKLSDHILQQLRNKQDRYFIMKALSLED